MFENALGYLPDSARPQWRKLARRGKWDDAARLFELDPLMMRQVAWLTHAKSMWIDVVTYCGPADFAAALARRFDEENLPVRRVFSSTAERMARTTSYEPDIVAVYDGQPRACARVWPQGNGANPPQPARVVACTVYDSIMCIDYA